MGKIVLGSASRTLLRVFVAGCLSFLCELSIALLESGGREWRQALLGAGAGALLTVPCWFVVALLCTGPWRVVRGGVRAAGGTLSSSVRSWFGGDGDAQRLKSASLLSGALVSGLSLAASYFISLKLVLEIVRPQNQAAAVALVHLSLAALALLLFAVLRAGLDFGLYALSELRGQRTWLDAPAYVALVLAGLGLVGCGVAAYLAREVLAEIHYRPLLGPGAATLVFLLALWLVPRRALGPSAALWGGLWLASWSSAWLLKPSDYSALALLEADVRSASLASGLLTALTDRDHDGHRSLLGGGDCRASDARFHPGAPDVPDNKLDEDCDGRDLRIPELFHAGRPRFHRLPGPVPPRLNIVLITVDAFAARHLKSFGYAHDTMPNVEALIKEGVVFDHCFAQGPSTRLSFPALFTSRYDSELDRQLVGRLPYPISLSNTTLAELFRQQGYRTTAVVPTNYFTEANWPGLTQGFDVIDTSVITNKVPGRGYNAELVTAAAIKQLTGRRGKGPLLLWAHYYDPHGPHQVPPGVVARGSSAEDVYDSELAYTDMHVGKLIRHVRKKLGPNTLIVLTGDHGYGFSGKRYARGGYGYDLNTLTLHVPMVFSAAFLTPRRQSSLCGTVDLLPTLLNMVGGASIEGLRGHSLVPELFSGTVSRPQLLFHQEFLPEKLWKGHDPLKLVSVRTPQHNYVLDRSTGLASMWKWSDDYREENDLLQSGRRNGTSAQLSSLLAAFVYESLKNQKLKKPQEEH